MTIQSEYADARKDSRSFYNKTGIQLIDFDLLKQGFDFSIPKALSKEERLFAILYVKKNAIDAKGIGELLAYSKNNWKKYGLIFLDGATIALTNARTALALLPPHPTLPPSIPITEPPLLKDTEKEDRKKTTYEKNVTISLALDTNNSLDENRIVEHAQRRIDLFFYLLIAYYKTGLTAQIAQTTTQHGIGKKKTPACHSALLTSIWDTERDEPAHNHQTRQQPSAFKYRTGLLDNTHFFKSLNSTVELDEAVNYFETHHLEGKKTDPKMREKSLVFLNQVSQGTITPIEGMLAFLMSLKTHFTEREACYLENKPLATSPIDSRALILNCEKKGSFKETWHENLGYDKPSLNDDYVNNILMLSTADKNRLKKQGDESNEAYVSRFHHDQEHIHEQCYARIKQEMNLPMNLQVTASRQGMFAQSAKDALSTEPTPKPNNKKNDSAFQPGFHNV